MEFYTLFLIVFLSLVIVVNNWKKSVNANYLAISILCLSIFYFIILYTFNTTNAFILAIVFNHFGIISTLAGPFLFFFVRGVLTNQFKIKNYDYLFFIPTLLVFIDNIPYFTASFDYKIALAQKIINNKIVLKELSLNLFSTAVTSITFRVFYILACTVYCFYYMYKFFPFKNSKKMIGKKIILKSYLWLLAVIISYALIMLNFIILINKYNSDPIFEWLKQPFFYRNLLKGLIITIPASIIINPKFLYGLSPNYIARHEIILLTPEEIEKVNVSIFEKFSFLDLNFNLISFAKEMNINKDQLSLFLEHNEQLSFVDFINKTRVEYLVDKLKKDKMPELSVDGLAHLAGFSTRQSLYLAFKRFKNCSPTEFIYSLNN